jgi:thiamine phosphate synthase YjbQ (UPF0047 family)
MKELIVRTNGRGAIEITQQVNEIVAEQSDAQLCHIFITHTSASLIITGNEDANLLLGALIHRWFNHDKIAVSIGHKSTNIIIGFLL